ncbi:MAG: hypothetical protein ACJ8G1_09645 [Vitreoscilla sp.]
MKKIRPPSRPAATPSPGVYKFVWTVAGIGFVAFVAWVANGVITEGGLGWWLLALALLPVLGMLGFVAAIGLSFVRQGRRNVREAVAARRASPPAPAPATAIATPRPPRRRSGRRR